VKEVIACMQDEEDAKANDTTDYQYHWAVSFHAIEGGFV